MRLIAASLLGVLMLGAGIMAANAQTTPPPPPPPAPPVGPVQVVTYLELEPGFAVRAVSLLKTYHDTSGKEPGAGNLFVFQETGAPRRFAIDDVWNDIAAFEARRKSPASLAFNDGTMAGRLAPPDTRVHQSWGAFKSSGGTPANGVYVKTHIDVSPPQLAALEAMIKPFIDASRNEAGALRFELLQQIAPRRHHTTFVESWASAAAMNEHAKAAHAREFRVKLGPILGAHYDQRVYKLVR